MKTTVKLGIARQIEVEPMKFCTGLHLCITDKPEQEKIFISLTPDQAGALIFGMEQALEVIDQRHRAEIKKFKEKDKKHQVIEVSKLPKGYKITGIFMNGERVL